MTLLRSIVPLLPNRIMAFRMNSFIPLLLVLSLFFPRDLKAEPIITLKILYSKNGRELTATLIPSHVDSGCVTQLFGTGKRAALDAPPANLLLASIATETEGPITLKAKRLKNLRTSSSARSIYFRAGVSCPSGIGASDIIRIVPKRDASGFKKGTEWLAYLKAHLKAGQLSLQEAFPNLTFSNPIALVAPGDGSNRLFIAEQSGKIYVIPNDPNTSTKLLFLDLSSKLISGGERGLLGIAFHPAFKTNGAFYVHYSKAGSGDTVISRYLTKAGSPNEADTTSEVVILEQTQPFANHNGGQLAFGKDGYLYIGLGDGGSGGDPQGNGQNRSTLLGKILRIDINNTEGGKNYAIPADNPFKGNTSGFKEEIFAYGFRNPWRFSFDSSNGALWVGDVGQDAVEEVDLVANGKNYGWVIMEGSRCYNAQTCDKTGLELPITEYTHSTGQSITGGFVYRGKATPTLVGQYIFADFVSGRVFSIDATTAVQTPNELFDTSNNISSFGVDEAGELYLLAYNTGKILKIR